MSPVMVVRKKASNGKSFHKTKVFKRGKSFFARCSCKGFHVHGHCYHGPLAIEKAKVKLG